MNKKELNFLPPSQCTIIYLYQCRWVCVF